MSAIDFRSDTVTKPDPTMRAAIAAAEVGDDVFGDDMTVKQLEAYVADLTGKEAGLWVPSGTMGNLLCTIVHCEGHSTPEVILGDVSHQCIYEAGNLASIGRIHTRQIPNAADGTLPIEAIQACIRAPDQHYAATKAVLLENTQNFRGGRVLPLPYVNKVKELCQANGLKLHCDGARLWHAAVVSNLSMKEVARPYDSISLCLSKALGAPMGSVIVGTSSFIQRARFVRKGLGGGTRQVGLMAAAGLDAVTRLYPRLREDHTMAQTMAEGLRRGGVSHVFPVDSNIVIWAAPNRAKDVVDGCRARGLWLGSMSATNVRAIPHYGNTIEEVHRAVGIVLDVMKQLGCGMGSGAKL